MVQEPWTRSPGNHGSPGCTPPVSSITTSSGRSCPPSMRRAVGTRGGGRMAVPRLAPWAGMRRRVATGGRLRRGFGLFVICHLLLGNAAHFHPRSTISDLRSSSRPWRLCGESFRRGRVWGAGARRTGDGLGRGRPSHGKRQLSHPQSTISDLRSSSRPWRLCGESFRRGGPGVPDDKRELASGRDQPPGGPVGGGGTYP